MYVRPNFRTKKQLREALKAGRKIEVFSPGPFPVPPGRCCVEGPWYPEPHRWYADVEHTDGYITRIIS